MEWETVKEDFAWDGSWRDIYIFQTEAADWQKLLDCLRVASYRLAYSVDSVEAMLPEHVSQIFATRQEANPVLAVDADDIRINCHFFNEEEIGFDLDPREISDQTGLDTLLAFLRFVGQAVGKRVVVTPENGPEYVFLEYLPDSDRFHFFPPEDAALAEGHLYRKRMHF